MRRLPPPRQPRQLSTALGQSTRAANAKIPVADKNQARQLIINQLLTAFAWHLVTDDCLNHRGQHGCLELLAVAPS